MTTYFQTTTGTNLLTRLNEACRVAGADTFSLTGDIHRRVQDYPDVQTTQQQLARELLTDPPTDRDGWITDALDRLATARAREDLAVTLTGHVPRALNTLAGKLTGQAHDRVKDAAEQAVQDLTEAAQHLTGDDPLDMTQAFANDATAAWKQATAALTTLGTLASIHGDRPSRGNPPTVKAALTVVSLPEQGDPQPVNSLTGHPIDPEPVPERDQARDVLQALSDPDQVDGALVRVARGDWPLVTLSLASPSELKRRDERSVAAVARVAVQAANARRVAQPSDIG